MYAANAQVLKELLEEGSEEEAAGKLQILAQLTRLRQICCDPRLYYENYKGDSAKLETCMELVESKAGEDISLLFSQFASMLKLIEQRLLASGIKYPADGRSIRKKTGFIWWIPSRRMIRRYFSFLCGQEGPD